MDSANLCTCTEHLAMASVPKQEWCEPYDCQTALEEGTLFSCLNLPFFKAPAEKCKCSTSDSHTEISQQNREEMMSQLTAVSFALNDLTLYLDTHPDCPEALAMFKEYQNRREALVNQYEKSYGALSSYGPNEADTWVWNKNGWLEGSEMN